MLLPASTQLKHSKSHSKNNSNIREFKMQELYKKYDHTPPHLFLSHAKYFITGSTYLKKHFLESKEAKIIAAHFMFKSFAHYGWEIEDWIILNNHYHLMANAPENALTLSKVIKNFHRFSALKIKKTVSYKKVPEKIWYNYWDTCITYEGSYFARINYIWFNSVNHDYTDKAEKWEFGSFYYRAKNWNTVKDIIEQFSLDRINVKDDF